jgi:4-hydroxybenzoate polyprenyltransferase
MNKQTIKRLFWSSRPVSWVNTAFPFAASYFVATGHFSTTLIIGTLYFLIPYNLLMYGINDVFDYESDLRNPRKAGLQGVVLEKALHKTTIWAALLLNAPFILYLFLRGSAAANAILLYVLFMVIAYSAPYLRFKERAIIDSFTSATHFVGPMLYGFVLADWDARYMIFVVSFFAWGMASHAFGAVQDIIPDRKAKIASIATYLGASWTVRLSVVLYLLAVELLLFQGLAPAIVGLFGLLYVVNIIPFWNLTDKHSAQATEGWKRFMRLNYLVGFVITLLLIRAQL